MVKVFFSSFIIPAHCIFLTRLFHRQHCALHQGAHMPDCSLLVMLAAIDDQCPDSLSCQALQNHGILIIIFPSSFISWMTFINRSLSSSNFDYPQVHFLGERQDKCFVFFPLFSSFHNNDSVPWHLLNLTTEFCFKYHHELMELSIFNMF